MRYMIIIPVFVFALIIGEVYGRIGGYLGSRVLNFDPQVGRYVPIEKIGSTTVECQIVLVGDSIVDGMRDFLGGAVPTDCGLSIVALGWWTPGNELAFFDTFGWPDATHMVIVVNSDDLDSPWRPRRLWSEQYDVPQWSGLIGLIKKEVLARIQDRLYPAGRERNAGVSDINSLLSKAVVNAEKVSVVWHPSRLESQADSDAPVALREIADRFAVDLENTTYLVDEYADRLHLNDAGKIRMTEFLSYKFSGL